MPFIQKENGINNAISVQTDADGTFGVVPALGNNNEGVAIPFQYQMVHVGQGAPEAPHIVLHFPGENPPVVVSPNGNVVNPLPNGRYNLLAIVDNPEDALYLISQEENQENINDGGIFYRVHQIQQDN